MAYIAKQNISKYKKGDVVPDHIAIQWESMYAESPVEKKKDKPTVSKPKESISVKESKTVEKE